jgi:hypothetical protein
MDQICLVVPITPGKTQDARDFMRELEEKRKPDYDRSERRIGVTKEAWYLARTSGTSSSPIWKPRLRPGPVPVLRVAGSVRPVVQAPPGRLHRP